MKFFYFLIFTVSITFSQNEIKYSDIIGEWEIKIKLKQLLKEEIKKLDMFEKVAAELASGFAEDFINSADMYIEFKTNDIAILTFDFLDYQEEEEIKWKLIDDEILIDDSLNKKINLGSENNVWILENDMIFLKEKNQALNKAVFLRKIP
tara:strand:+ start:1925 stop:2374 length:450 start_codon:yes stop_codon:yes gene_type:complete